MTTIAWDGQTLAADRMISYGDSCYEITKIQKFEDYFIGTTGTTIFGLQMVEWFKQGAIKEKFPSTIGESVYNQMIVIDKSKTIFLYECGYIPVKIESKQIAIGSGSSYALAAMKTGMSAIEAVRLAIELDIYSGFGVDSLEHLQ